MVVRLAVWIAAISLFGLAACSSGGAPASTPDGGSGGGGTVDPPPPPPPPPPPSDLFIATDADRITYETVFLPAVSAMSTASVAGGTTTFLTTLPVSGSIDYAGYLEILVGASAASANVAAPTSLTLDLAALSLTGTAGGFMGTTFDENLEEQVVNYAGTITLTNGSVSAGASGTAAISIDIDGTLDSGLNVFTVDGTLVGGLYGASGEGLRVRGTNTGLDGSMVTTVDGAPGLVGVATISATAAPASP